MPDEFENLEINNLLSYVAKGTPDEVSEILGKNPHLAFEDGEVTDYSGRTFKNITALQLAVWNLDWHMKEAIVQYLPEADQLAQIEHFESQEHDTEYGLFFDFRPFLIQLEYYNSNFHVWNRTQCKKYWCETIGATQKMFPAHAGYEYCRVKNNKIDNWQDWFMQKPIVYQLKLTTGRFFFDAALGKDFAISYQWWMQTGGAINIEIGFGGGNIDSWGAPKKELEIFTTFFQLRFNQMISFIEMLKATRAVANLNLSSCTYKFS